MIDSFLCHLFLFGSIHLHQILAFKEYCQFESFNATCRPGEVVMMMMANYGRLRPGRCVTRDYGYLGCSVNVITHLDKACTGKRSCLFPVPLLRNPVQPCPRDLTAYLEAHFVCVPELVAGIESCNKTVYLRGHSSALLHLQNILTANIFVNKIEVFVNSKEDNSTSLNPAKVPSTSHIHTTQCSFTIKTNKGQTIKTSFFNFGGKSNFQGSPIGTQKNSCEVDVLLHNSTRRNFPLCQQHSRRQDISISNDSFFKVRLEFHTSNQQVISPTSLNNAFLFEVVGCPDMTPSSGTHYKRTSEGMVVKCNSSKETWTLTCKNNTWMGTSKNCSEDIVSVDGLGWATKPKFLPNGLIVAVVVGAVFGMVSGVVLLLCAYVCQRRRERNNTPKNIKEVKNFCKQNEKAHSFDNVSTTFTRGFEASQLQDNVPSESMSSTIKSSKRIFNIFRSQSKTFPQHQSVFTGPADPCLHTLPSPPPPPGLLKNDKTKVSPPQTKEKWFQCSSLDPLKKVVQENSLGRKSTKHKNLKSREQAKIKQTIGKTTRLEEAMNPFGESCLLCRVSSSAMATNGEECKFCTNCPEDGRIFFTENSADLFLNSDPHLN